MKAIPEAATEVRIAVVANVVQVHYQHFLL